MKTYSKTIINQSNPSIFELFVQNSCDNLKSPLTSIRGLLTLANYYPQHRDANRCLTLIEDCVDRMDMVINSLQDYLMLQHIRPEQTLLNANQVVKFVLADLEPQIRASGVTVTTEIDQKQSWIGDAAHISIILRQLILNGIQYSDRRKTKKQVKVSVAVDINSVTIRVADNGVGINPADGSKVFEPLYKGSDQSPGLGLGLFLVSEIVDKIDGTIRFKSKVEIGTAFTIVLPNNLFMMN